MKNNLPNFLIVGAAKSGTTSLFDYLDQHPEVFVPEVKETKYFTGKTYKGPGSDRLNGRIINSFDQYQNLFNHDNDEIKASGDISPDYLFYHNEVIPNVLSTLGDDVKIIIILRNPIDRAFSAYLHKVRDLLEKNTFEKGILLEEERKQEGFEFLWLYKEAGLYVEAVEAYKEAFKNVKVYLFDDLKAEPDKIFRSICDFLAINPDFAPDFSIKNYSGIPKNVFLQQLLRSNSPIKEFVLKIFPKSLRNRVKDRLQKGNLDKSKMKDSTREELRSFYKSDIEKLSKIINRDLSSWI